MLKFHGVWFRAGLIRQVVVRQGVDCSSVGLGPVRHFSIGS